MRGAHATMSFWQMRWCAAYEDLHDSYQLPAVVQGISGWQMVLQGLGKTVQTIAYVGAMQ